ncbi:MAG: O-antigen ligase family protein, partial [Caulobacteraceae bacterium]
VIDFTVLICLSVLISATPLGSIQALIVYLVGGTAIFFVAAFAFRKPGTIERWAALIWATAVALSIMCGFEHHVRHVLWAGHVPSFLKVNDKLMARYLAGGGRNYTGIYRSNGPFSTSLGMGEFLALATPFILQFLIGEYRTRTRIAAGLSIFVVFFGLSWTGSRTGIIGFLIALLLYVLIWGVRRWRAHRSSLLGPATVLAYPAIGLVAVALTFVSGRVHNFVWGNGATKSSNDARTQQWHMALPKILHRPWGYGIDRAGVTLNYHQPNGLLTIDIYWLALVLEYGILGALLFLAILASGVSYSARRLLRDVRPIRDLDFLNSTMAALAAFIVMAITFAGEDNLPIVYMILGAVAALTWRARNEVETPRERSVSAAPAIDAGLGRTRRRPVSADVS